MWISCQSIGAVTRFGLGYDPGADYTEPPRGDLALPPFDAREELGRKGFGMLDRSAVLGLLAARDCLTGRATDPDGTGVTVGTTLGGFEATADFASRPLREAKPYDIPPLRFPTAVMNFTAGQIAIRHRLRGANTTIAGGEAAGLTALSYLTTLFAAGMVDSSLLVVAEELSPHRLAACAPAARPACAEAATAFLLVPGSVDDRLFRMRVTPPDPLPHPGSHIDIDSCRKTFGNTGAAVFGCQLLMARSMLRADATPTVAIAPASPVATPGCEVAW
ncbi:beta-ketoacyl synthase N-terminal-like domain-containing protein [Nocardia crassostreae]|uniref:beta-ketoacyl synthase N-terminal-like domain-containing protein n=1 Tax=Nocardia crassostreae TaxID=53428 RepID=UPI00082A06B2|nr:beta-ketoacyl synthase N-terminal-like domain-containing protein [Nocardia crassostreae]